jgi:hypothetical protein
MCSCLQPNVNGTPGYSWDGKNVFTRPVDPPQLNDGDVLLFDEPGRCGGMDSHCHHYRLVKYAGSTQLLVRHGGGTERLHVSLPRGFSFNCVDSNTRYWLLNAIYHAANDARRKAAQHRQAFAEGRLKKRRLRKQDTVKIWIEPKPPTPHTDDIPSPPA